MERATNLNDSPKVIFDIDEPNHTYFITEIPIHSAFLETTVKAQEDQQKRDLEKVVGYELLTPRQKDVLALIVENNKITYREMKAVLGIKTDAGINKHIDALKVKGAIKRKGTLEGIWVVIKQV